MQEERYVGAESARSSRQTVIIVVDDGDIGALEKSVRGLAENSVLPGLHVCFVASESMATNALTELHRVARLLEGRHSSTVTRFGVPLDFGGSLREVAASHPGRDVVLIAPGVELPFAWDARLAKAAYAAPDIAVAVPMCDVAPLYELVDEAARADVSEEMTLIDRTAYCMGERGYYEIPRIHPVCAYIRRDALEIALPVPTPGSAESQSVLDALAKWWRACGWSCVICDYLYVGYSGNRPLRATTTDDVEEAAFLQNHPLGALRRAVNDAIRRGLPPVSAPGLDHRPVQLHIMHFWGGGLERWVRDFGRADPSRINMILTSYRIGETGGQRIVLYSDPAALIPVRTWDIARPIRSTASSSIEYRRILEQIIVEFEIEAIIVSSLIGHSLDALTQARKTIVVCHDFYPICQAINPQFGRTCERCTLDDLRRCAEFNPLNDLFGDQTSEEWHAMRGLFVSHLLSARIEIVVPSPSVAATLKQLDPRLEGLPIHVIPHGLDLDAPRLPIAPRTASQRLRIVVLGRLSVKKGATLLRAACDDLRALADITLVGCGDIGVKLAEECGWNFIERYERDALPDLLRSLAPHAGLLASIIPETFSYTLSELIGLGVPPIVTSLGSFNDRIVDGESGFLFGPTKEALVGVIRRLHAKPELLETVARNLASRAQGRTTAEMVNDYRALLPLTPRPVARFRVGVGQQTGLTEPYRHLNEAYSQLAGAYAQSIKAYEHTKGAFEKANGELGQIKAALAQVGREFESMDIKTHWWRVLGATRLLLEFREKIRSLERNSHVVGDAGNGEHGTGNSTPRKPPREGG
jgi:glycosyltransferase involved in cell wall biosynthesis